MFKHKSSLSLFIFLTSLILFPLSISPEEKKTIEINIPKWYLNPPVEKDKIYVTGFARKNSLQLAVISAGNFARSEISRLLKAELSSVIKQFIEEAGVDNKSQAMEFTEILGTSLTSNILYFSIIEKQEYQKIDEKYIAYILIGLDLNDMNTAINGELTRHSEDYEKMSPEKKLEELEREIIEKIDKKFSRKSYTQKKKEITDELNKNQNEQEENISTGKKPSWVITYPTSTEYYIGIGNGNTLQQARDQAINSLAAAIQVKIKSEINDYLRETNGVMDEQILENIRLTVKDDIEEMENAGLWYSEKEGYWAYYRLNIEKYKQRQQEKIDNAKLNAMDFLTRSDEEKDPSLKFKYAFLGYYLIGKYISRALKAEYKGKEILIVNELTSRMQKILNGFKIASQPKDIEIDKINPVPLTITYGITYEGLPVKNFPVIFRNNRGVLDITEKAITDDSGNVFCILNRAVSSLELQSYIIQMDLNEFIKDSTESEEDSLIFYNRISRLGLPSLETFVRVNLPVFAFDLLIQNDLDSNEKYKDKVKSMSANFKYSLSKKTGAKFTDKKSKLLIQMLVDGTITRSENSGNYYTRLVVTINVIDSIKNEQIFSRSTPARGIKGGSSSQEKSVNNALDIYMKEYNDRIIEDIFNYIEGKKE